MPSRRSVLLAPDRFAALLLGSQQDILGRHERQRADLATVLELCYAAGLDRDEGEYLAFGIAVLLDDQDPALDLMGRGFIPFAESAPLELRVLSKLAVATTPRASCLVISRPERGQPLRITGLAQYPAPWLLISDVVWVESLRPGCLRARSNSKSIQFIRGEYAMSLEADALEELLPPTWAAPTVATFSTPRPRDFNWLPIGDTKFMLRAELVGAAPISDLAEVLRRRALRSMSGALLDLLAATESIGRGGSFVVAERGRLLATRSTTSGGTWFADPKMRRWAAGWFDALALDCIIQLEHAGIPIAPDGQRDIDRLRARQNRMLQEWDAGRVALARLTVRDGLTAFDPQLTPLATGLRVNTRSDVAFSSNVARFLDLRGEGHRSVAHAVLALGEGAMGFRVSHDGGFVAFFFREGQLDYVRDPQVVEPAGGASGAA